MAPAGTGFGSWMKDIEGGPDGIMDSMQNNQASMFGRSTHEIQIDELKQEMKVLHWHKLANEAALKAALIRTKRLKEREASSKPEVSTTKSKVKKKQRKGNQPISQQKLEKIAWMKRIIQDEQRKPLEVNEEYIRSFASRERFEQERHEESMERHISNLKKVKRNLKQREQIGVRNRVYKQKKRMLDDFISASRDGKTVTNSGQSTMTFPKLDGLRTPTQNLPSQSGLNKVIHSLDKLVELEKRICNLESEDDRQTGSHRSATSRTEPGRRGKNLKRRTGGSSIGFAKSRTMAKASQPSRNTYQVRVKQPKSVKASSRAKTGASFLTSVPDDSRSVTSTRSRKSTSSRATSHSQAKSIYSRGRRKQDQQGMRRGQKGLTRRSTRSNSVSSRGSRSTTRSGRERSQMRSSKTTKARPAKEHLKEFHDIRRQFEKKKHDFTRNIHENPKLKKRPVVSKVRLRQQQKVKERTRRTSRGRSTSTSRSRRPVKPSSSSSRKLRGNSKKKTRGSAAVQRLGVYGTVVKGTHFPTVR